MASLTAKRIIARSPSCTRLFILVACLLLPFVTQASPVENHTTTTADQVLTRAMKTSYPPTTSATVEDDEPDYEQVLRNAVARLFASMPSSIRRKLLEADVRPECSIGLFRLMRGFQNLEPWALRLFDASGKYPSGLLQATKADLGAFDECLETVVRDNYGQEVSQGQYCSLLFHLKENRALRERIMTLDILHPLIKQYTEYFFIDEIPATRLGICIINDCNKQDLQAIIDAVKPKKLRIEVESCVTINDVVMTPGQTAIIAFLAVLGVFVGAGTIVDIYMSYRKTTEKSEQRKWLKCVTSFSALHNTRAIFTIARPRQAGDFDLSFIHGLRFFSLVSIVLGHSYGIMSDAWSRTLNLLILSEQQMSIFVTSGFVLVDTFFFISGFLVCLVLEKQNKSGLRVFIFAVIRRLVRTTIPLFFIVMCISVLPLMLTGPGIKNFFEKMDEEVHNHWWHWLLQIRNFYYVGLKTVLPHVWYLSMDFQFFVVAVPLFMMLKNRKPVAIGVFAFIALFGCCVSAWQVTRWDIAPFMVFLARRLATVGDTVNKYYILPSYHAVCYFTGCIVYLVADNFRQRKVSKVVQITCWVVSFGAGVCCMFIKCIWYTGDTPTSALGKMATAFFDRIMWSMFIGWITLACISGRGGFVSKFLSWPAFVPLSRLSFAVYLIHFPFIDIMLHASRERLYYSNFNQVTLFFAVFLWSYILAYFMYLVCEGPTANLDKLAFSSITRPRNENEASTTVQKASNGTREVGFEIPHIVLDDDGKKVGNGTH
nr:nose resistant to fluoxetine protein 6-like [Dermacentor andersoni]